VTVHIAALADPSVQEKGTVLAAASEPASAPPKGFVLVTHDDAQTEVSQDVIAAPALVQSVVIPVWHPGERLLS
jgi:hypothetical protein